MGGDAKADQIFGSRARGLIWYRLSPYELRVFPSGFVSHFIKKWWTKFNHNVFYVAPPMLTVFVLYKWANEQNERNMRKPLPGAEGGPHH